MALERIPHAVVLSKADLLAPDDPAPSLDAPDAWEVFVASSVSRAGLAEMIEGLWRTVDETRRLEGDAEEPGPFPELEEWRP